MTDETLYLIGAKKRWLAVWSLAQNINSNLNPPEKLDKALSVFIQDEIENYEHEYSKVFIIGAALSAVSQAETHSETAVKSSAARLLKPPKPKIFTRPDNKIRKLAFIFSPFFGVSFLFYFLKWLDRDGASLLLFIFLLATILSLLMAFTKLSYWLTNDK